MSVVYKIKNKDGLYSTGGTTPKFVKDGKVWSKLSHLKNHLRSFKPKPRKVKFYNDSYNDEYELTKTRNEIPKDWVIVQFEETKEVIPCWKVFGGEL